MSTLELVVELICEAGTGLERRWSRSLAPEQVQRLLTSLALDALNNHRRGQLDHHWAVTT
jgi:hypothetical protein